MAGPIMRERTIAFYEVVANRAGEHFRVGQMDWQRVLEQVENADVEDRTWESAQTFVGTIFHAQQSRHLLLHRVKDAGEWLSVMNLTTGEWRELESRASEGYLETSAMSFTGFGNVVGIMQGSTSSPTHKSLEGWLNELKILTNPVGVRPLVSQAEVERLQQADAASRVEIRIGSHKVAALAERDGRLARFFRTATADYGDINVTLTISVPRGKGRDEDRRKLLNDIQDLAEVMPAAADLAKARLIYSEAGGEEHTRLAEFVEHHITAKRRVPAVDDKGQSIRISSAVGTIIAVAAEHEAELKLAADVD